MVRMLLDDLIPDDFHIKGLFCKRVCVYTCVCVRVRARVRARVRVRARSTVTRKDSQPYVWYKSVSLFGVVEVCEFSRCCTSPLGIVNVCESIMGWLRLVGSLKLLVSFAEYRLFYRALLQKRPVILRSLHIVATPYVSFMCVIYLIRVWLQ